MRDPLKLADKVVGLLKNDGDEGYVKASQLVRRASKSMACTVSWNHLIDYAMGKRRVTVAVRNYNEVGLDAPVATSSAD